MTASGPILWYMRLMGFKGWTSLWNVCYYYPGYEHHEWLIRRDHKKTDYEIEARANEWPAKQG